MGKALIDIARTLEDKEAVLRLIQEQTPNAHMPDLSAPNQLALMMYDEDTEKIVGAIHIETASFVRHMVVDPTYAHAKFSITLLFNLLESLLRIMGLPYYYFSVPRTHTSIITLYEKAGAQPIEIEDVRFLKRLKRL